MDRFDELREKVLPVLKPYVKRISVFGSFARGEETPDSDIDLLVELKAPGDRPRLDDLLKANRSEILQIAAADQAPFKGHQIPLL